MMCSEGASPLATLCYKAGSTLDEVLALEEEELFELSKEIVGNTVLDHARVLKQWRRCRLEEVLRKEVEAELEHEERDDKHETQGQDLSADVDEDETIQLQQQQDKMEHYRKEQQEQIGEDWQEYLRKQIREEMHQEVFLPNNKDNSIPRVIVASSSNCSQFQGSQDDDDDNDSFDEETWYSLEGLPAFRGVGNLAFNVMGLLEEGLNDFFLGPPPPENDDKDKQKNKRNKKKSKRNKEFSKANNENNDYRRRLPMPKLSQLV